MKSLTYLSSLVVLLFLGAGCQKTDFDNNSTGEGIDGGKFRLQSPATTTNLALNAATPAEKVEISWTAAKPGVETPLTYKWVAVPRGEDINNYKFELPADDNGKATKLTITYQALDTYLGSKGVAANTPVELTWSIEASNGETKLISQDAFTITLKRFGDGASPFILYGPESSTTNMAINPTSTTDMIPFKWQQSKPATGGPAVKYQVVFVEEKRDADNNVLPADFTRPLFSIQSDNNGLDSALQLNTKRISDSLAKHGYEDVSKLAKLQWTVIAGSGSWKQQSAYTNAIYIQREVTFYLVGNITGWDINNPMAIISDLKLDRYGKVFYAYLSLKANDEFKFFKTKGDWGSGYGSVTDEGGGAFTTGFNQGGNFKITADGIYRVTLDVENNKAWIQQKQVGIVGNMQGWSEGSPINGVYLQANKFLIIANSSGTDEFKFHDGTEWNNSAPNRARWWGKGAADGVLDVDGNGANLVANTTPYIRAFWDGTNPQQVKYTILPGTVFLIGDATAGGWNENSDQLPALAYQGNGLWKATVSLTPGQFKFLLKKGTWDYNYGGPNNDNNPLAGGAIKEGSGNIVVGTAGTYTVELDEYKRTYKVY